MYKTESLKECVNECHKQSQSMPGHDASLSTDGHCGISKMTRAKAGLKICVSLPSLTQ